MTQFFLIYFPSKEEYFIKSIGVGRRYIRIPRPTEVTDEEYKDHAIKQFDRHIDQEQILNGEIVKSAYIF